MPIIGTIYTDMNYTTIDQIKQALSFADRFDKLYPLDYTTSLSFITACISNYLAQEKIFADAVSLLNGGANANEVKAALSKN